MTTATKTPASTTKTVKPQPMKLAAPTSAVQRLVQVDPKTLLIGANVRKEAHLTDEFVESIKTMGVLQPVTASETPAGLEVVFGQRRTLAAVQAGLTEIPVMVTSTPPEEFRLAAQIAENKVRNDLDSDDALAAFRQLALFDVPVATLAKQTGVNQRTIATQYQIAKSKVATSAVQEFNLNAAQYLADFEGMPEQDELLKMLQEGKLRSWQLSDKYQELQAKAQKRDFMAEHTGGEIPVLNEAPETGHTMARAEHLCKDDNELKALNSLEDLPLDELKALAGDHLRMYPKRSYDRESGSYRYLPGYAVIDWKKLGMRVPEHYMPTKAKAQASTPEEKEALKAERAHIREMNQAWALATEHRMLWLAQLLSQKTPPKGWELFVAPHLFLQGPPTPTQSRAIEQIMQITHSEGDYTPTYARLKAALDVAPQRAAQFIFGYVLGIIEGGTEYAKSGWKQTQTPAYLNILTSWGYEPTAVESELLESEVSR